MTTNGLDVISALNNLTDKQFEEVAPVLEQKIKDRRDKILREREKSRRSVNERKQEREKELGQLAYNWCLNNLQRGMLVKVPVMVKATAVYMS